MAKQKINEYKQGSRSTSYILDIDENNNTFKRVCIFFNDPITDDEIEMQLNKNDSETLITEEGEDFFVDTDEIDAKIEAEKEFINITSSNEG